MSDAKRVPRYQLISPNIPLVPYRAEDGIKRFVITAEPIEQSIGSGVWMKAWGYNGCTPGPLLAFHEHERVQILFRNRLPEATAIHWHGLVLPNHQDGVPMLGDGPYVPAGEDHLYEFTVHQTGTFLYHAHMVNARQQMMGLGGMMIVLPLEREEVDKEFALLLQQWNLEPIGAAASLNSEQWNWAKKKSVKRVHKVNPNAVMHNYFTLNGKTFPDTAPLTVRQGERIRIRVGNLGQDEHPVHLHGHIVRVTAVDGNPLPQPYAKSTVGIAPYETKDLEFVADNPGVWAFHCTKPNHVAGINQSIGGMMTTLRYADSQRS